VTVRRRLVVAFVLVAGLVTGALAVSSYLLVRNSRQNESVSRALEQARANLRIASTASSRADMLAAYTVVGGFTTTGVYDGQDFGSSPFAPDRQQVPAGLRNAPSLAWQRTTVAGVPYLVVAGSGGGPRNRPIRLDFFFSEQQLQGDLDQLRNVLAGGWLAAVLIAGLAGMLAARSALLPVARAGQAAHAMAAGALNTRLGAHGRDEFGRFATAFDDMADALESKIDALAEAQRRERRFTADVAHELRTPLTALVGEASLLAAEAHTMGVEGQRLASLLVDDVDRLRRLVDELIEVSRIDAGADAVRREQVDVRALVDALVTASGWQGRTAVTGSLTVHTDGRRLERILGNLIENAIQHTTGAVEVRLAGDGAGGRVEVEDHGQGIADGHLPHLFDRFYKADSARSGGGSGLGLAIAGEHASALGGSIAVRTEQGGGSTFTLTLPVSELLRNDGESVA
jgi:two-component system, OmpR family, sensor histidine kinase MtrB